MPEYRAATVEIKKGEWYWRVFDMETTRIVASSPRPFTTQNEAIADYTALRTAFISSSYMVLHESPVT